MANQTIETIDSSNTKVPLTTDEKVMAMAGDIKKEFAPPPSDTNSLKASFNFGMNIEEIQAHIRKNLFNITRVNKKKTEILPEFELVIESIQYEMVNKMLNTKSKWITSSKHRVMRMVKNKDNGKTELSEVNTSTFKTGDIFRGHKLDFGKFPPMFKDRPDSVNGVAVQYPLNICWCPDTKQELKLGTVNHGTPDIDLMVKAIYVAQIQRSIEEELINPERDFKVTVVDSETKLRQVITFKNALKWFTAFIQTDELTLKSKVDNE